MDITTVIVGGALLIMLMVFVFRLVYTIMTNLVNGRKFHHSLDQQFNSLRLSNMLTALGINKTDYLYQTKVKDIHRQMNSCTDCTNTDVCDEKLATKDVAITKIPFCNNEEELKAIKQQQSE